MCRHKKTLNYTMCNSRKAGVISKQYGIVFVFCILTLYSFYAYAARAPSIYASHDKEGGESLNIADEFRDKLRISASLNGTALEKFPGNFLSSSLFTTKEIDDWKDWFDFIQQSVFTHKISPIRKHELDAIIEDFVMCPHKNGEFMQPYFAA